MGILATFLHKIICKMSFDIILELQQMVCNISIHTAPFWFGKKTERKTSLFAKVFTQIRTKTSWKWRFSKTLSKVDIHKYEGFWNAFDQCEGTKMEFFENASIFNHGLHKNRAI